MSFEAPSQLFSEEKTAEDKLRRSEQRYRSFVQASAQVVWTTNAIGEVDMDIPAWQAFTGQSAEEARGLGWMNAILPEDRGRVGEAWRRAVESRGLYEVEYRLRIQDGTWRNILARAVPILEADGRIREYVGTCIDVTERTARENEMRRLNRTLRALGSSSQAMLRAVDESQYLQEVCRIIVEDCGHAMVWIGYAQDDEAKSVQPVAQAGFEEGYLQALNLTWADTERGRGPTGTAIRTGQPSLCRNMLIDPRFTPWRAEAVKRGYAASVVLPLRTEGKAFGAISIYSREPDPFSDDEVKLLSDLADDLAYGIGAIRLRLAHARAEQEMREAKEAAEAANQAKDHFLAVLSHELRTPLTPVLATVSMLQEDGQLDADTREALEVVRRNAELEAHLIDDLLDVTRIARSKIELDKRPMQLREIIHRTVEVCRSDLEARRLDFGIDMGNAGSCWVEADAARLQQVFWNLLKNAIKFTPQGGRVGIRCRRDDDAHVVVEVSDSGVGLEPQALGRIFNAFEQAERSVTRQFGGLGLGLTISKALVEMHGGTIEAHSEGKGLGATFRVRLPLVSTESKVLSTELKEASALSTQHSVLSTRPSPLSRPLRILLVEDHPDTIRIMTRLLARRGHEVHSAGDVAGALELAGCQCFDLLISDLGLPDASGVDLIRELRSQGQAMPAIALSGYGQEEDLRRSHEAGFNAHLTKPVNVEQLYRTIAGVAG